MLRPNLEALARRDPELVQRICWPVESDHVVIEDSGEVIYRLHQARYRLSLDTAALRAALPAEAPEGAEIFVFGFGLGELVDAILSSRRDLRVVAWERDPWMMRLALGQNDWTQALASGRLRLLLGSDLVEQATRIAAPATTEDPEEGAGAQPAPLAISPAWGLLVFHPFLATVYRHERMWLDRSAGGRRPALVCAGGLFTDDLTSALVKAGFAPFSIDIQRLSRQELDRTVARLQPAIIAAVNYADGLAEFAASHRCKLICWQVDPTTSAPPRADGPTDGAFLFTYRRAQVAELRAGGFTHVEYLPLAADLERRAPVPLTGGERARYTAPVSFVGSSLQPQIAGFRQSFLTGFAPGRPGAVDEAARVLDEVLAEQRRDFSRFVVDAALEQLCPELARRAPAHLAQLARWASEIAAAEKRFAYVSRLGRFGVRVWGDEGWRALDQLADDAGDEAGESGGDGNRYQGPAGHGMELTKIYCGSQINVDIGRLYQDDIVTMRVFDVLACGGFVLAERSPALGELFEIGAEVDCYATLDELEAKVAHYLAHPEVARAIAFRGREAVRRRHDVTTRVAHMLSVSGAERRQIAR